MFARKGRKLVSSLVELEASEGLKKKHWNSWTTCTEAVASPLGGKLLKKHTGTKLVMWIFENWLYLTATMHIILSDLCLWSLCGPVCVNTQQCWETGQVERCSETEQLQGNIQLQASAIDFTTLFRVMTDFRLKRIRQGEWAQLPRPIPALTFSWTTCTHNINSRVDNHRQPAEPTAKAKSDLHQST